MKAQKMTDLERYHETLAPSGICSFAIVLKNRRNLSTSQVQQMLDANNQSYSFNNLFWVKSSETRKTFFAVKLTREGAESFCKSYDAEIFESWKSADSYQ